MASCHTGGHLLAEVCAQLLQCTRQKYFKSSCVLGLSLSTKAEVGQVDLCESEDSLIYILGNQGYPEKPCLKNKQKNVIYVYVYVKHTKIKLQMEF